MRNRVLQRLTTSVGISVVAQAAIFLALAWSYRIAAHAALEMLARTNEGRSSPTADGIAAVLMVALDLFVALAVGFFGARRLLRSIVRATPHPMKPPTRPITWAALSAAGLVVAFSILAYASNAQPLTVPWFGWAFELLRDAAIAVLFWFAAARAIAPKPVRS